MGRHKDLAILGLFEELKIIGESYGFKVTDEFTVLSGVYFIDMVWTPYEDHNIMITFEVEKADERTIDNIDKIIGTPTTVIEKPFQHFTIVFDEKLKPSHKIMIDELSRRYNINVFEDYKNKIDEQERFHKEISKLKQSLQSLIQRQGLINPQSTVEEALLGIGKVAPVIFFENKTLNGNDISTETPIVNQKGMTIPPEKYFDKKK